MAYIHHHLSIDGFLDAVKNGLSQNYIALRNKYDLPLNYEVLPSDYANTIYIFLSSSDIGVTIKPHELYNAMEKIANFTNNDLKCGCTFTIG